MQKFFVQTDARRNRHTIFLITIIKCEVDEWGLEREKRDREETDRKREAKKILNKCRNTDSNRSLVSNRSHFYHRWAQYLHLAYGSDESDTTTITKHKMRFLVDVVWVAIKSVYLWISFRDCGIFMSKESIARQTEQQQRHKNICEEESKC